MVTFPEALSQYKCEITTLGEFIVKHDARMLTDNAKRSYKLWDLLAEEGQTGVALGHYEYITSLLYHKIGVKPSPPMRDLYRRLKADTHPIDLDISSVFAHFKEQKRTGEVLIFDQDTLAFLHMLDMRRSERKGFVNPVGLLAVTQMDFGFPEQEVLKTAMIQLKKVLLATLRKGDAICFWNQAQVVIIFNDLSYEDSKKVLRRIENNFTKESLNVALRGQIQSLLPWE